MNRLFNIIEYNIDSNVLTVELDTPNRCHIPLDRFESWLKKSDRLQWVNDYSDASGEHCQETGEYSLEQYWELPSALIKNDIYDFIVIHFVSIKETLLITKS